MGELRLEAQAVQDDTRWRWVLTDVSGAFLADHEVRLDPSCWQYEAFTGLPGYLKWHAAPDRRTEDEARIVAELGSWVGAEVLGPVAGALARSRPVTVRVSAPESLLFRPLELAHVDGEPLAVQHVTLVMETGTGGEAVPVGDRLRLLGLFSMPEGSGLLNLRSERHSLVRLVRGIAASGKAADVRVLQYGVTRERLREVLGEDEGWDIIHVSGHGTPGELLLETAAGQQDLVTASDLAGLLNLARKRVKLVTVAACWSAAATAADQRRILGLPAEGDSERGSGSPDSAIASGALATELASRPGCAVLAMRYRVGDEFASALTGALYRLLADKGEPLPRALGMALHQLSGQGFGELPLATPTLFGGSSANLRLAAPGRGDPSYHRAAVPKMAGFPLQPDRFVGRTGVMARSSAALAAESGVPGVLLHGMPGSGKSACALELAYGHEHAFEALVWYKAPDEGMAIDGSLTDLALTLERHLDGFRMAHMLVSPDQMARFLPQLTELAEQRRLLIVIDNAESLLGEDGSWRDPRWGSVTGAICGHSGLGRLILTSRRVPTGLTRLRSEAVDVLSADESLLLAGELPHLRALIHGEIPGVERQVARRLARHALNVAQGHPKLLELADGQAAHPERLAGLLEAGDQAWRKLGTVPDGFFTADEPTPSGADYLNILAEWTTAITQTLTPGERDLFWFLCCIEESDRTAAVLTTIWPRLWNRLRRDVDLQAEPRPRRRLVWPRLRSRVRKDGESPDLSRSLAVVVTRALAAVRSEADVANTTFTLHPGVAAAGRAQAGSSFQAAVDAETSDYWTAQYWFASGGRDDNPPNTRLMVHAGLAAIPYLMRQEQWEQTAALLEIAFNQEPTRANAASALPVIEKIGSHYPDADGLLARVLQVINPAAAETRMLRSLEAEVARGDFRSAAVTCGRLVTLYRRTGQLPEALVVAGRLTDYAKRFELGPWTRLSHEVYRSKLLVALGQASEAFAEVNRLRDQMRALPAPAGPDETVNPHNVRESLLDTGQDAANLLGQWETALEMSEALTASMSSRRAPVTELAKARFGAHWPLLQLGRTDEALDLLLECRQTFESAHDVGMLGMTFEALANTEHWRGHRDAAVQLQYDALRYKYLAGDMIQIADSYHNLGTYLIVHFRQPGRAVACHLAAALVRTLTGAMGADESARAAAADVRISGLDTIVPQDLTALCREVGDIPGTDLASVILKLSPVSGTTEQALSDLTAKVKSLAANSKGTGSLGGEGLR